MRSFWIRFGTKRSTFEAVYFAQFDVSSVAIVASRCQ